MGVELVEILGNGSDTRETKENSERKKKEERHRR